MIQENKQPMFHFWFNSFFVVHPLTLDSRLSTSSTSSIPTLNGSTPEDTLVLTLRKDEIDKANKDKTNKLYSPNLKVNDACCNILCFTLSPGHNYFIPSNGVTSPCNLPTCNHREVWVYCPAKNCEGIAMLTLGHIWFFQLDLNMLAWLLRPANCSAF